mmetsp:Transcript_5129/g.12607  ORF Transcript_5129/g.12607 Transcript_5129/m.12607 type:complete len:244 (-) Transcript_5129:330-1061(-)
MVSTRRLSLCHGALLRGASLAPAILAALAVLLALQLAQKVFGLELAEQLLGLSQQCLARQRSAGCSRRRRSFGISAHCCGASSRGCRRRGSNTSAGRLGCPPGCRVYHVGCRPLGGGSLCIPSLRWRDTSRRRGHCRAGGRGLGCGARGTGRLGANGARGGGGSGSSGAVGMARGGLRGDLRHDIADVLAVPLNDLPAQPLAHVRGRCLLERATHSGPRRNRGGRRSCPRGATPCSRCQWGCR